MIRGALRGARASTLRKSFELRNLSTLAKNGSGQFGLKGLHSASDWARIGQECVKDCQAIVDTFYDLKTVSPQILQRFDDLSDRLCRVLDCAELCRNVHPDPAFASAADDVFAHVSGYMQELNADVALYESLVKLEASSFNLSTEETIMSNSLKRDFERGGIHLEATKRSQVVELQNELQYLGAQFNANLQTTGNATLHVAPEKLAPLPASFIDQLTRSREKPGYVDLSLSPSIVTTVLKWVKDPVVRRMVYENSVCLPNSEVLQRLQAVREEVANKLGFENYLSLSLVDRVSTSPESVRQFLEGLASHIKPKAEKEVSQLRASKTVYEGLEAGKHIYPWDRSFYTAIAKRENKTSDGSSLSEFFPLHACIEGLGMLMKDLFGIELRKCADVEEELWHPDVMKMEMRHESEGVLGHIFLDLFPRDGKYNHAAQFTIRCGRLPEDAADYQRPLVALVCNFQKSTVSGPILLAHSEMETLFHEFGHAVHSLLAKTRFQNLSGTRGAVDFVEIPSHLFEHFAWDHRILSKFARSVYSGRSISESDLDKVKEGRRAFAAMDIQQQIMLSALDLELHTHSSTSDWTKIFSSLQRQFTSIEPGSDVPWQTTFGHVVGYGAGYYSYLYARVLAAEMWQALFKRDPLSRSSGDMLRNKFLVFGGSRDPRELITSIIGPQWSLSSYLVDSGIIENNFDLTPSHRATYAFRY